MQAGMMLVKLTIVTVKSDLNLTFESDEMPNSLD